MFNSPPFDVLGDPVKSLHKARNVSEICRVFRSSSLSENAACFLLFYELHNWETVMENWHHPP
nr:MAG TPA: hypothetical protein [Caudoviricetes sp.]DAG34682.1 MAG TPA: hypothetical protein [Caudoviricetes sp.]DAZ80965.1 MAG TPA: hypothetical protein [Caudoviricetes sp.]